MSTAASPFAILSRAAQMDTPALASGDAWLLLLDFVWQGQHLRLVRNPSPVQFDAGDGNGLNTYEAYNFELEVDQTSNGKLPTIQLHASNVLGVLQSLIEQNAGIADGECNIYVLNTGNPAGEPDLALATTVQKVATSDKLVTFELSGPSPLRLNFPRYSYRATYCMWLVRYKGPQCLYNGTLPSCDGTYDGPNGCQVHGNTLNFGACPGIGTNGIAIATAAN